MAQAQAGQGLQGTVNFGWRAWLLLVWLHSQALFGQVFPSNQCAACRVLSLGEGIPEMAEAAGCPCFKPWRPYLGWHGN